VLSALQPRVGSTARLLRVQLEVQVRVAPFASPSRRRTRRLPARPSSRSSAPSRRRYPARTCPVVVLGVRSLLRWM
jgi:hypothetical protein